MTLTTCPAGEVVFARIHPPHPGRGRAPYSPPTSSSTRRDWRGGLRWMAAAIRSTSTPPWPIADELAGTGAYSAYEGPLDEAKMKKMAFRTNWKASWDFPYMGMFLPPVADGRILDPLRRRHDLHRRHPRLHAAGCGPRDSSSSTISTSPNSEPRSSGRRRPSRRCPRPIPGGTPTRSLYGRCWARPSCRSPPGPIPSR